MRKSAIIASRNIGRRSQELPDEGLAVEPVRFKKKFCLPKSVLSTNVPAKCTANDYDAASKSQKPSAYRIFFCKRSTKKHKNFSDGILIRKGNTFTLFNEAGKQLASKMLTGICDLGQGSEIDCGTYDIEVDKPIEYNEYESGNVFIGATEPSSTSKTSLISRAQRNRKHLNVVANENVKPKSLLNEASSNSRNNPFVANALVLYKPKDESPPGARYVTLCPFLSERLRPHQREGVQFLFNCLTGLSTLNHYGAILADEMGLGKTLQCISVIWTLLKDGPTGPVISRAIVVVPSSLVDNWANEFKKWIGDYRMEILTMQPNLSVKHQKEVIGDFVHALRWPVLVISYEMCRKFSNELSILSSSKKGVLLVCDEGHRLKNAQGNQTINALEGIGAKRRLLITGTPIQNQLDELYAMCSFVNPGLLSTLESFRNNFIKPIVAWREAGPDCPLEQATLGQRRAELLQKLTSSFILRRTSDILSKYLPTKTERVLFCKLSKLQIQLYSSYISSQVVRNALSASDTAAALQHITALRKLVNDPSLFYGSNNREEYPADFNPEVPSPDNSSKMAVLESMLSVMHSYQPPSKTVIVSNFTQTLTLIDKLCGLKQWKTLRLDGSTPSQTRQSLVTRFNDHSCQETVFLLSAKAGGCGLNLIGASHLILFDPDWNPAVDEQAMARIWRDGQLSSCVIYRFLTKGGIDEKIFQRQLSKQELSMVVDGKDENVSNMNRDDLKKLFDLNIEEEYCQTKTILDRGFLPSWNFHCDLTTTNDPVLLRSLEALPSGTISFSMSKSIDPVG